MSEVNSFFVSIKEQRQRRLQTRHEKEKARHTSETAQQREERERESQRQGQASSSDCIARQVLNILSISLRLTLHNVLLSPRILLMKEPY